MRPLFASVCVVAVAAAAWVAQPGPAPVGWVEVVPGVFRTAALPHLPSDSAWAAARPAFRPRPAHRPRTRPGGRALLRARRF